MVSQLPGFSHIQPCVQWNGNPVTRILSYTAAFSMKWSQLPGLYAVVCSMKWYPSYRDYIQPCVQWSYRNNLIYSRVFNEMVSQLPGFSDIQPCVQWNDIPVTGIPSYTAVCSMKWYPSYRDPLIYSPIFDEMVTQNTGIIALCLIKWYSGFQDYFIYPIDQDYLTACSMKWYPSNRDFPIYSHSCVQWNDIPISTGILRYTNMCSMKWYPSNRDSLIYTRAFNEMASQLQGFPHIQPCVQWNCIPVTGILSYIAVCSMKWYPSYRDFLLYRPCVQWNGIPVTGTLWYTPVHSMKWHPSYQDSLMYSRVCLMKLYSSYRDSLMYSRVFNEMASQLPEFSDIQPCIQWNGVPNTGIRDLCLMKWYPSCQDSLLYLIDRDYLPAVCLMKWYPSYWDSPMYSHVFNEMVSQLPGFCDIQQCLQWNGIPNTGITALC